MNQSITKLFVEQPLASPGSAKYLVLGIEEFFFMVSAYKSMMRKEKKREKKTGLFKVFFLLLNFTSRTNNYCSHLTSCSLAVLYKAL